MINNVLEGLGRAAASYCTRHRFKEVQDDRAAARIPEQLSLSLLLARLSRTEHQNKGSRGLRYPSSAGEGASAQSELPAKVPRVQLRQMAPNANLIDFDRAQRPSTMVRIKRIQSVLQKGQG